MLRATLALAAVPLAVGATVPPITAEPGVIGWLKPSQLAGSFVGARHDDPIEIQERRCGSPAFTPFLEVPSDPQGGWHLFVSPTITTTYRARFRGELSATTTIRVRPQVTIREVSRGRFLVTTLALKQFSRKTGVLERFTRSTGRWLRVRTFVFSESGATTGTTSVTRGRFRSQLPRRTLVRALLPSSQARPCYEAGVSNMLQTR